MTCNDLERTGALAPGISATAAAAFLHGDRGSSPATPWAVRALMAVGAWLAGIFFAAFLVISLDLDHSGVAVAVGGVATAGALVLLRLGRGLFLNQLALACSFAGHILIFLGIMEFGNSQDNLSAVLMASVVIGVPIYWISRDPVQRFLSVAWVFVIGWIWIGDTRDFDLLTGALAVAVPLAGVAYGFSGRLRGDWWRPARGACLIGLFGSAQIIVMKAAGAGHEGFSQVVGVLVAAGLGGLLWYHLRPSGRATGWFVGFAALLGLLALAKAPGCVAALGLLAVAHARGERLLEGFASLALGVFLVVFYHQLDLTLGQKSLVLMVAGALLLGVPALVRRLHPSKKPRDLTP
jgi:hypothetical protein